MPPMSTPSLPWIRYLSFLPFMTASMCPETRHSRSSYQEVGCLEGTVYQTNLVIDVLLTFAFFDDEWGVSLTLTAG